MIDDLNENTIKVLELSQEILELIEQNIVNFSSVEIDTIVTTNESIPVSYTHLTLPTKA